MINKQGLWFLTLFSLILVLSIYYITMPNEVYTINGTNQENNEEVKGVNSEITTSNYITTLKVELETQREEEIKKLEETINDTNATASEKDNAYVRIKEINNIRGLEEQAVQKIKDELSLDSCVEIDGANVSVVTISESHDKALASKIMKMVQTLFTDGMVISVKFA